MPRAEVLGRVTQAGRAHLSIADVDAHLVLVQTPFTFGGRQLDRMARFHGRPALEHPDPNRGQRAHQAAGGPPDVGKALPR